MILLPGALPRDRATLAALCAGLGTQPELAVRLQSATVEPYNGTWSDAERESLRLAGDLRDGVTLRRQIRDVTGSVRPESLSGGVTFAIATPLHAALGLTDLTVIDPAVLSLSADDSRALCEAADVHFRNDGVRVHFVDEVRWLVSCEQAINVLTERPNWLIGEPLRPNLPRGKDARLVERWMNELQMLLFTHPVNIAREDHGLPPVNVVWLWGFGDARKSLPVPLSNETATSKASTHLTALRKGDVAAWQSAWIDASSDIQAADSIILGDAHPALRLTPRMPSATSRFTALFKRKPTLGDVLSALQGQL